MQENASDYESKDIRASFIVDKMILKWFLYRLIKDLHQQWYSIRLQIKLLALEAHLGLFREAKERSPPAERNEKLAA
ncbi:CLUMA_CG013670, isoform A [Clunio marinus]|uniref:CLUMA_CG013670, isoform A n=1 Tax=Clunio marinus TaxID=568069 RepID=A0A1J1IJJ2_9DIPT|nr:CLUMA_CG013670, isoform A [Clunio marinus]